jgi:hypothetical protein
MSCQSHGLIELWATVAISPKASNNAVARCSAMSTRGSTSIIDEMNGLVFLQENDYETSCHFFPSAVIATAPKFNYEVHEHTPQAREDWGWVHLL